MGIQAYQLGQKRRGQRPNNAVYRYPAPVKGIDTRISLSSDDPNYCPYTYNLVPFEYGMQVRKGYREWQIDVHTDPLNGKGVHTLIPFDGIEEQGVRDRLFAVTNEGIWDVTASGSAPVLKLAFANQADSAGYGVYCHYVDNNETDLLFYADSLNGLFVYDEQTETWQQAANITGPVVENIRFVVLHKQRLWVIEENSTKAWYLPIGSSSGEAVPFFFGSKFRHGGNLEGLFNWTVDGGDGVDDYLVAVSRAGDVLPYQGTDPSDVNTWSLVGTYYIGEVPRGPYFGTEHGGELFLLSAFGITSMNDLLKGADTASLAATTAGDNMSAKITGILRSALERSIDDYGWEVRVIPSEGAILVSTPKYLNRAQIQFYYNLSMRGWGMWRDLPMTCFDSWKGRVVFGTADNKIMYMDVPADNVLLDPPEVGVNGVPIRFSILTSFLPLSSPAVYKHVSLIRPDFLSNGEPSYTIEARYDYNAAEVTPQTAPPFISEGAWDVGEWDIAMWDSDSQQSYTGLRGGWGYGRYVALAMIGESREETRLLGWDVVYTTGGPLI